MKFYKSKINGKLENSLANIEMKMKFPPTLWRPFNPIFDNI